MSKLNLQTMAMGLEEGGREGVAGTIRRKVTGGSHL
jgi:hypothetical protein